MNLKRGLILTAIVLWALISAGPGVFGAEELTQGSAPQAVLVTPETAAAEIQDIDDLQWVWAEVISLHAESNQMVLKYLDYEADTEKEMVMGVDDKTTYENVKSLSEIKVGDAVSLDYITDTEGKNIAKNVNVEKVETLTPQATEEQIMTAPAAAATQAPPAQTDAVETAVPAASGQQ